MIIPDLANPFFVEVMCGVEETARNAGYSMIFSNSNENPAQERENLAMLYSQELAESCLPARTVTRHTTA
jgi:DNA-binding LacI/PurR family transcriptional regulator